MLLEEELVTRLRTSRFPADIGYAFRHALVCDAAGGLLTDADRHSGHLAASHWLESMGETDAVVLARHAEDGGDLPRAITFYASEVMFRVAAAESLFAGGNQDEAGRALRDAVQQIDRRAVKLSDPVLAHSFHVGRDENRRAREHLHDWRGD